MPTKAEVIRELVRAHFRVEEGLQRIAVMRTKDGEPIKLLEVNENTVSTGAGSIEVFSFSPTRDVPYVTEIAEVTPEQYARLEGGAIRAPVGWTVDDVDHVVVRSAA